MSDQVTFVPTFSIDYEGERKKPRLLSILFCDHANQTDNGKANLVGIFDRLYVDPNVKRTSPFILYVRTAETYPEPIQLVIFNPEGKFVGALEYQAKDVQFSPNRPAQIQHIGFMQFNAETEGVYWAAILYNGEIIGGAGLLIEYKSFADLNVNTDTFI